MIIIAILVKLTSKGPVFYVSERIGRGEKPFKIYKFRSMKDGADKEFDALLEQSDREGTFKMKNDPRITKFGKFLRKTSLDELPQLFNILFGSMSVIGPRPISKTELSCNFYISEANIYVSAKPGLTGYWQVKARSNADFETGERQKLELEYFTKRGFWYDLGLIFRTIPAVLRHKGAQ